MLEEEGSGVISWDGPGRGVELDSMADEAGRRAEHRPLFG